VRELFSDRDFVAYFLASQGSSFAYRIEGVAVGWQVFQLRHLPFDLGLVGLMLFLPAVLLALPAGFIADRFDRRIVALSSALGELFGMLIFALLAVRETHSLVAYLAATFFVGAAHAIGMPSDRSLLAGIVHQSRFMRAQATTSSLGQLIVIAGPAVGGALLAFGAPYAFGAAALAYGASAGGYLALRPRGSAGGEQLSLARSALEGIRFIFSRRVLLGAISLDLFAVLFGGAVALLPVYAVSILHVGAAGLGILRSAPALGAAVMAGTIARFPLEKKIGPTLFVAVAGFGIATIVFGLSKNLTLSLVALVATGAFDMISVVIRNGLVQLETPNAMRGRVSAVENVFIGASNELGAFESGTLAAFVGTEASVVIGGIGTLVVIGLWSVLFPQLRRFNRFGEAALGSEKG
jgi:MFS family permease